MKYPVHQIRFGFIKASVFQNQTKVGDKYSVSIVRLFKNGEQWKQSTRFSKLDLPLVAKVADMAHTWIYDQSRARDRD